MKIRTALLSPLVLAAACATAPAGPPPPPSAPPMAPPGEIVPPPEAPDSWQLMDLGEDHVPGASVSRAYRELLGDRRPARTVTVAIIDSGVDTAHVDLRAVLWSNPGETPGNGRDDDGNGYVDDVRGWNFIGGPDGRNIDHETLEMTRLYKVCRGGSAAAAVDCKRVSDAYQAESFDITQTLTQIQQIKETIDVITPILQTALGGAEVTPEAVEGIESTDQNVTQAKTVYLQMQDAGIDSDYVEEVRQAYQGLLDYGLNPDYDPRGIVGDDPTDGAERDYGNSDVTGPDASHGTHVSGIVAAGRGNGIGVDGVASNVRLMIVRAVPDGDERDKDVANAIRYAVDNGAQVINMSFGKAFSPQKELVDAAVRYADEHGVLMIHASGNDGEDIDVEANFPNRRYLDGREASNWIEVGAANWTVGELAASFSNYGQTAVDLFAPGVAILSTEPDNEYDSGDGTSYAAPIVTGVAALLMSYFPDLGAADVKQILMDSALRYGDRVVPQPGSGDPVPFSTLSVTGGVVNAYEAVKLAESR